jgi:hypothetical protein
MEKKRESIESKKAAPGEEYGAPAVLGTAGTSCARSTEAEEQGTAAQLPAREGRSSAPGTPATVALAVEGTVLASGDAADWSRGSACEVGGSKRLMRTDPSGRRALATADERSRDGDAASPSLSPEPSLISPLD